jgi:hypothetical protein
MRCIKGIGMGSYLFDPPFEKCFVESCTKSKSVKKAALELGMNYETLSFDAKRLGCFKPNQAGKGHAKKSMG